MSDALLRPSRNAPALPQAAQGPGSMREPGIHDPHPPAIDLHIEHLVLHGIAAGDRGRVGAAIERELARLLAETGTPQTFMQGRGEALIDGGSFTVAPGADADAIGAQVARAVYRGLTR